MNQNAVYLLDVFIAKNNWPDNRSQEGRPRLVVEGDDDGSRRKTRRPTFASAM